jgi:hypothetical protein
MIVSQEYDQFTSEPPQHCHRCDTFWAPTVTNNTVFLSKTVNIRKVKITAAAAGQGL